MTYAVLWMAVWGGEWNRHGYFVTNDQGWSETVPVYEKLRQESKLDRGGIGLFIGHGAVHSLLPHTDIELHIVLDINPAVTEFTKLVDQSIKDNETPSGALEQISDEVHRRRLSNQAFTVYPHYHDIVEALMDEADSHALGNLHWIHPENYEQVREHRSERPVEILTADVMDPKTIQALKNTGLPITFANFTNLVEFSSHHGADKDTVDAKLRDYPLSDRAGIFFSSGNRALNPDYPESRLAIGRQAFLAAARWLDSELDWRWDLYGLNKPREYTIFGDDEQ